MTRNSARDWYKDAVFYEVHVKAFMDANGDGVGDFAGLTDRLDYVQELGVDCLWILPMYPSPLRDDGYDIADYRGVHPSYGDLDDFRLLVREAHRRGIAVIIELVVNHTSDQHPWFQRARRSSPGSEERDYYVWSDSVERYSGARIIFLDTERSNWSWDDVAQAYYWHRFFNHQPDLNFDNPRVLAEILEVMDFWLEQGVDGFRLDAIPYLVEREGTSCENLPETHQVVRRIRAHLDLRRPGCMLLAEANQWPWDARPYFGEGDECHMAFHFPLMPRIFMALRQQDAEPLVDILRRTPPIPDSCQWGLFLRNHDELTLEMVTEDEREYMVLAYASDPRARLNLGIRRRLAPLVDNYLRRIELLNGLLFSLPGTPILYYGDEIGMGDDVERPDRDGVRSPMQWTAGKNAGFSEAPSSALYSQPIADPVYAPGAVNVDAQRRDPSSLYQWMRRMIRLRRMFPVFGRGSLEFVPAGNRAVLAYVRRWEEDAILCVANMSSTPQPAELELTAFAGATPVEMLGVTPFPVIRDSPYFLSLPGYGFYWFELRGALRPLTS
ncbi:MAG TPA: maltose alpha-D-glucosyltransferase [Anaeromyxobacteraceae bacterium]